MGVLFHIKKYAHVLLELKIFEGTFTHGMVLVQVLLCIPRKDLSLSLLRISLPLGACYFPHLYPPLRTHVAAGAAYRNLMRARTYFFPPPVPFPFISPKCAKWNRKTGEWVKPSLSWGRIALLGRRRRPRILMLFGTEEGGGRERKRAFCMRDCLLVVPPPFFPLPLPPMGQS